MPFEIFIKVNDKTSISPILTRARALVYHAESIWAEACQMNKGWQFEMLVAVAHCRNHLISLENQFTPVCRWHYLIFHFMKACLICIRRVFICLMKNHHNAELVSAEYFARHEINRRMSPPIRKILPSDILTRWCARDYSGGVALAIMSHASCYRYIKEYFAFTPKAHVVRIMKSHETVLCQFMKRRGKWAVYASVSISSSWTCWKRK